MSAPTWSASVCRRVDGLAHLEEEAGGEDALVLEAVQVDLLDPGQLSDRWHVWLGTSAAGWLIR